MNDSGDEPELDAGITTTRLTERIVKEIRPYLVPNKVQEATQHIGTMVVQELHQEFHQGPLPPPRQLLAYEQALPGSAERIMTMAENEQGHRHDCEGRLVRGEVVLKFIGQAAAFAALIVMIILLAYMVYLGYPIQAAALGTVMITGVVGLFLAPKFFHRSEQQTPQSPRPPSRNKKRR